MIPLRSIPTVAISLAALMFVAWMASMGLRSGGLYAPSPAGGGPAAIERGVSPAR